ncbi:tetratricopeptide repeat protein [Nostocaceae cyanobacterium CENA369]|uniref:Tetratricopeptide repeat protein n=1 Tax=Dendronalium phyllosphericum CENA369 TaxID=1725256 RepID=A0A8J7LI77_9NOST|nr:tetratricopeptide repeat protein [Dendronalium phyllosphericum]MBH8574689.1 tetratricopeptide repeat protein [Dendronalium phyllosphericum CENA369]
MSNSAEDYLTARAKKIERKKRLLSIVSIISFVGSAGFGVIHLIQYASQPHQPTVVYTESLLEHQARGYELVLQREPNNQVALEKLSLLRLQLKDIKGSVELLEKLVKQYPNRQDYKMLLEQMKKQEREGDR